MCIVGDAGALQDQPLTDMGDNIAAKRASGSLAHRHHRRNRPAEIFSDNSAQPFLGVNPQRFARFDLVAGYANVHNAYSCIGRARAGPRITPIPPA